MKKMEAMMELLTEEIEGFNKSIRKLEGLSENFKDLKVKADTSSIEYYMKEFLREQKQAMITYKEKVTEINRGIKSARIIPNWLAVFFCIAVSIQILSLSYFAHHYIRFEDRNRTAFKAGQEESNNNQRGYFEDHPVIYEDFKKWNRKKDSISNQK